MADDRRAGENGGDEYDVVVVGAGPGGIYGVHRFAQQGLSVLGLEAAGGVGGVWYHNRYPGARVDLYSVDYSYHFSPDIIEKWSWSERYASQAELLDYLDFVADTLDVRRRFLFDTRLTSARWHGADRRWHLRTDTGLEVATRFLVMATGNLSEPRQPPFPGLDRFRGDWFQTSHWPQGPVALDGRRIGIVGTGSTGVQAVTALGGRASHLYVFQRTANYSVPAQNRPVLPGEQCTPEGVLDEREALLAFPAGTHIPRPEHPLAHYSPDEQQARLEQQWAHGGQGMNAVFADQGTDPATNVVVAEFVRQKIRQTVTDPAVAEALCPYDYPIGSRRLCLDTGYYEQFNRDDVTLVDVRADPIREITPTGLATESAHYDLDVIIFALGFHAFRGALDQADIRNEAGLTPGDAWARGPRTLLGLMTRGFPNLFLPTGPGSPSVLANMILLNEVHMDWIADCIAHMDRRGLATVEPTEEGEASWTAHVAEVASRLLRLNVDNYMVHVNDDDGSRVFMPYAGGLDHYMAMARAEAAGGYRSLAFA
ncbi:MAG TPA: NAD(P)/FAD-dependent oxidoreductase [Acidimicrobiales bacterium]|nr:NAD(P)/FAD-dependent oxidoreductase [Acidimicrobiales bacterium]